MERGSGGVACSETATSASTLFPGVALGLYWTQKILASFFGVFLTLLGIQHLGSHNSGRMEYRNALSMRSEGDNPVSAISVEIKRSACLLPGASRLKGRKAPAILLREQL
jgi:hypothetical protein